MGWICYVTAAMLSGLAAVAPVTAQSSIVVSPGQSYKHDPSGIRIAPQAAGLPLAHVVQYDDQQLDVALDFRSPDQREVTTVYLFRDVTGDVPVWFDRIQKTMETSTHVGSLQLAIPPAAFTPAGQKSARGLRAVYSSTGTDWKSSAAAMTSFGQWYVSVRASSQTLTPDQLLARVEQTFAAISWPKEKVQAPAVAPVADCPNALTQGEDAQPVSGSSDTLAGILVMAGLDVALADESKKKAPAPHPVWCRDPLKLEIAGVYRPDGATDQYLLALNDAGRGISVAKADLVDIVSKSSAPSYSVEFVDVNSHRGYGTFSKLPPAAQALWLLEHGTVLYSARTWGKDRKIDINSDAAK